MMDYIDTLGMGGALWVGLISLLSQTLQFGAAIWLLCRRQPKREGFTLRATLSVAGLIVLNEATMFVTYASQTIPGLGLWRYAINFATYSAFLLAFIPAILACYDTSVWNALFYVTAGYTIQNLGTGAGEIARLCWEGASGSPLGIMGVTVTSNGGVLLAILACLAPFIRKVDGPERLGRDSRAMIGVASLVILVVIANDVIIRGIEIVSAPPLAMLLTLRVTHLAICVFVLFAEYETVFNARLRSEVAQAERMAAERERQYALSRENIDAINMKCHDIRHQIRHLADGLGGRAMVDSLVLDSIAREVDVYDSVVRTGNDALDTILTEKSLLCESEGITLTCIADGHAIDFMPAADIYALFGNALDNAIRAVRELDDPAQRTISLTVRQVGAIVTVHVANLCAAAPAFVDGLPQTTQEDRTSHGFGTRSMRAIAERHGGTLTFGAQEAAAGQAGTFAVDAMIPVP